MKWKQRFNGYLTEAIKDVPESERVILDTGDGAAICFLGAPEAAMFAALQLSQSFVLDERDNKPGLSVRLGINLGPVKLVKDINGALNAIGDGINAGQRIMSFASVNKILVSQSFFEVVSRLSDDYKTLFQLKGIEKDKHIREHTVYHLVPPEKRDPVVANAEGQAIPAVQVKAIGDVAPATEQRPPQNRTILWLLGGIAALGILAVAAAVGVWHFYGSSMQPKSSANATPVVQNQASTPTPAPIAKVAEPAPPVAAPQAAQPVATPVAKVQNTPAPPSPAKPAPTVAVRPDAGKFLQDGKNQLASHNEQAARESFRKAADAGNPQATVLLGTLYAQGLGGPPSDSDAVRMFRQAADLGNARGMYNLGLMYEAGRGIAGGSDNRAAAHWYTESSNRGDRDAAFRLGLLYEQGQGVTKNLNEARRLYSQAGTPDAMMRRSKLPPQ